MMQEGALTSYELYALYRTNATHEQCHCTTAHEQRI